MSTDDNPTPIHHFQENYCNENYAVECLLVIGKILETRLSDQTKRYVYHEFDSNNMSHFESLCDDERIICESNNEYTAKIMFTILRYLVDGSNINYLFLEEYTCFESFIEYQVYPIKSKECDCITSLFDCVLCTKNVITMKTLENSIEEEFDILNDENNEDKIKTVKSLCDLIYEDKIIKNKINLDEIRFYF